MKAFSGNLFIYILPALLLLSGCGNSGKTSAKLEVTNGFIVSANGYDGGLIIVAKKDTGETVSASITDSLSTTMELPNGNWTFKAVGWFGYSDDKTYKFGGTPYCGFALANLTGQNISVSLGLDPSKCDDDRFADSQFRTAGTFKNLASIHAHKTLIKYPLSPGDPVSSKIFSSAMTDAQIIDSIPVDLKSQAKAVRIFAMKKELNGAWANGFSSRCLGEGSSGIFSQATNDYSAIDFKIPTRMPLAVGIYEDEDCTKEISQTQFPQGLENPAIDGDHLMQLDYSSNSRLFVVASKIRRGYSPFMALLPTIQCGTEALPVRCKTQPTTLPDFVLFYPGTSEKVTLRHANCGQVSYSVNISGTCTQTGNDIELLVNTELVDLEESETITAGETVYNIAFQGAGAAERRQKKWAFNDLLSFIGPNNYDNFRQTFINGSKPESEDKNRDAWGLLGKIREHLSSAGGAGLFGISNLAGTFRDNCAAASGTKEISLTNEDGVLETYRVTISAATLTPDTYTCSTLYPDSSNCSTAYEKKMQVFNLDKSSTVPQMTFTVDCDMPIGKFSSKEEKIEDDLSRKRKEQMIVAWNTDTNANHRYQRYEYIQMYEEWQKNAGNWVKTDESRAYGRVSKSDENKGQIMAFSYNTHTNVANTSRQSVIESRQLSFNHSSSLACVTNYSQASSNLSAADLFNSGYWVTHYSAAQVVNNVPSLNQLSIGNTYANSTYGTTSTACNITSNKLSGITSTVYNNHKILKLVEQNSNSLGTINTTVFGSNAFLDH